MKKTMTVILAALVALAIFISPVVFSGETSVYAQTDKAGTTLSANGNVDNFAPMRKGGRGGGRDRGNHKPSTSEVLNILADFSGFSTDALTSVMEQYKLSIPQLVNTVILAKAGNISLEEAAKVVSEGNLRTYIEEKGIQEKFMETRRELAQYMRGFKEGYKHGFNQGRKDAKRGADIRGKVYADFVNVLANWAGVSTENITSIQQEFGLNPARTINVVVLAKVSGMDLQASASIVVAGDLKTYLDENGLLEAFENARQEVMSLLREEAQSIKEETTEKIVEVLAQWSGFDKDKIQALANEKNVGYAITVVVLAKVGNISLDEAKQIIDDGKLMSYLREKGLFTDFRQAKVELMRLIRSAMRP